MREKAKVPWRDNCTNITIRKLIDSFNFNKKIVAHLQKRRS